MYSEAFYHALMERHDADRIVNRAARQLEEEAQDRAAFRKWLTPSVKAEFINGSIIMHSPVRLGHLNSGSNLQILLTTYVAHHQLGRVFVEKALVEMGRNDFEPDLAFWIMERTLDWTSETNVFPPPDLAIEILSKSTEKRDRGVKYQTYLDHGVQEYWIVDPIAETIEQHLLATGTGAENSYTLVGKLQGEQPVESQPISGFVIPAAMAFSNERALAWIRNLLA